MAGVTCGIIPPVVDENLLQEVALAIELIRSIGVLLEISQTHRQPIPPALPHNLALVAKHLDNASTSSGLNARRLSRSFSSASGVRAGERVMCVFGPG